MKTLGRPADRAEIVARLRALGPTQTRRWGRMSVHQMVCHLADAYRMATGEKRVRDASGPLRRTVVRWFALYAPLRWPSGIRTIPEIDQDGGGTTPAGFAADVACVVALVEGFAAGGAAPAWAPHPIFGPLSTSAWLRWGYLHADHHLRQFGA